MPGPIAGVVPRPSLPFRGVAVAVLIGTAWFASACASSGAVPRPFPLPGTGAPAAPRSLPPQAEGQPPAAVAPDLYALAGTALALRGTPYRNGGADPSGFDCSGFTQYVFAQYGIGLPRAVHDQYQIGSPIDASQLEPGDLIFFATTAPDASHVGIALGGDQFVHAPSSNGVVRVERLSSTYWSQRFVGARRVSQSANQH